MQNYKIKSKGDFTVKRSKKLSLILTTVAMSLLLCVFALSISASGVITEASLDAGRSFVDGEAIQIGKDLTEMPKTYEAVVYVPSDVTTKGAILSNYYPLGNVGHIDFAIGIGGTAKEARPTLDITDQNNNRTRIEFRKDIKGDSWVHVVITHEINEGGDIYTCYVNGEKVSKSNINYYVNGTNTSEANLTYKDIDIADIQQSASIYLGQAYGYSATTELGASDPYNEGESYQPTNFKGRIKNVALYSDVLTESEIKDNYSSGINVSHEDIMLCFDLTEKETKSGYITDVSGNGYDTIPLFHERTEALDPNSYDYAFALLGDTQFLVDWDVKNDTDYTADIFNWIVANKDDKKIAHVLGVGDIVESGRLDDGVTDDAIAHAIAQWQYAVSEYTKLEAAGIPYTITWGYNHDGYYGEEFTTYFGNTENFSGTDLGFYFDDEQSADYSMRLANYYRTFEVSGVKYLFMCIEYRPETAVLDWADAVIKANPDRKVIINTHYFLDQHGNISQEYSQIQPKWDKLANENKNVQMILCGHVARQNNIVRAYTVTKAGQTVAQLLLDPQQMDRFYGYDKTGVVAMLYFSNNGDDVRVELISTAKTMDAMEADPNAQDILYGRKNEFKFGISGEKKPAGSMGEVDIYIIAGQSNAVGYGRGELTVSDDRFTEGFEDVLYYGNQEYFGKQDIDGFIPVTLGLGQGTNRSGAEIGIAYKLDGNGRTTVVIKCAQGATPLYPVEGNTTLEKYGSWTSPSFMAKYPELVYHDMVGAMYERLITTLNGSMGKLISDGYTLNVKGILWMQGEVETGKELAANAYEEALTDLIGDMRTDLTKISGTNCSQTPVVLGKIKSNHVTVPAYTSTVCDAQEAVAEKVAKVSVLDTAGLAQQDSWHYVTESQRIIGERFVDIVSEAYGNYVTPYGEIPAESYNPINKPFAIFYDGSYMESFAGWKDALEYIKNTIGLHGVGKDEKVAQLVLLSEVTPETWHNLSQMGGTLIIDLNGFTLNGGDSANILNASGKPASGKMCTTTLIFKNGNITVKGKTINNYSVPNTAVGDKTYNYTFENVNFSFREGASITNFISVSNSDSNYKMYVNLTFNGCTFDLTTNAPDGAKLFSLAKAEVIGNVKINGGKIIKPTCASKSLVSVGSDDTVTYGTYNGEYTELVLPTGVTPAGEDFNGYGAYTGKLRFAKIGSTETSDIYQLSEITTKYGDIPTNYLSPEKYPFILFVYDGDTLESVVGYSELLGENTNDGVYGKVASALKTNTFGNGGLGQKSAVILQRRDYTSTAGEIYWNFAQIRGVVTHDLNGYTLSQSPESDAKSLFMFQSKAWGTYDINELAPTHIYFTNGNMVTYSAPIMELRCSPSSSANYTISDKDFTVKFSDVTFSFGKGATATTLINSYAGNVTAKETDPNPMASFDLIFEDCYFDLFYNVNASSITILDIDPTAKNGCQVDFKFYGCDIRAREWDGSGTGNNVKIFRTSATNGSTVTFYKSAVTNEYLKLLMTPGADAPSADNVFYTENGTMLIFTAVSTVNNIYVYTLKGGESTKYGEIPSDAGSAKDYPFALFVYPAGSDKPVYVGVYAELLGSSDGAFNYAKEQIKNNEWNGSYNGQIKAVLLMRRDYTLGESETYANFAQIRGEVILDLGGHTLSQYSSASAKPLFGITSKPWGTNGTSDGHADVFPSIITIENGTILTYNSPVFKLGYNSSSASPESLANKLFTINMNGVTVGLKEGATTTSLLFAYDFAKSAGKEDYDKDIAPFAFNLKDCVLDLDTVQPEEDMIIFDLDSDYNYIRNTVTVVGGTIKLAYNDVIIANDGTIGTTLTFVKGNAYTTLVIKNGDVDAEIFYDTDDGKKHFVMSETAGTYILVACAHTTDKYDCSYDCPVCGDSVTVECTDPISFSGVYLKLNENINVVFTVKTHSCVENPYMEFTFRGKTYTVTEYSLREDGTLAFSFEKVMPYYMCEEIVATLYGTKGEETVSVSQNGVTVKNYCDRAVALNSTDAEFVALASDLLVYGAKAQVYAGYKTDALATDGVAWLAPTAFAVPENDFELSGEASDAYTWTGAGLNLTNEMNMYMSFSADSIEGLSVMFTINGREYTYDVSGYTPDADGKYRVYFYGINAYEFGDAVSVNFVVDEAVVGDTLSYSVDSYISYMYTSSDVALADLVKAISNYGKSAYAYKN